MPRRLPISEQLRRLIESGEVTRYRISQETGIGESTLSRFATGQGGLSLESIDAIGGLLDLEISKRPKRGRR